jgi:Tfp pilus assembly protein FimT
MNNFHKKGVTIIELLIIITILGILILIVLPQFSKIRENQVLKAATNDIISSLYKARSETLASVNSSEYGVHFQSDQVIIFKGMIFSSGAIDNETIKITAPVSISNVTFNGVSGTSGDVYFNRLYAVPSVTGTITVATPSISKIITISATGSVSLN